MVKIDFHYSKLRKHLFIKKIDGKMSNFKMLGRPWAPLLMPMPLKLLMTKRLGKITKIYLPIRI